MPRSRKNPWLAVNLSMFFPGVGQIYAGERVRGGIIAAMQTGLLAFGFWQLLSPYGNTLVGAGFLFAALIVHVMGLIDTYERMTQTTRIEMKGSAQHDPWFPVFLNHCIPGLGHLFIRKWLIGSGLILMWLFMLRLISGPFKIGLIPLLITLSAMHVFVVKDGKSRRTRISLPVRIFLIFLFLTWCARLSAAYLIVHHFSRPFYIPSASMQPTLRTGDQIIVHETGAHGLKRGDVIVFQDLWNAGDTFVKRVAGLPGDTLQIVQSRILINNRFPNHRILKRQVYTQNGRFGVHSPFVVPESTLFVLGDYSEVSIDSRFFGPVSETSVIGRAYKIVWPPEHIGPIR